jgi:hypothetical protein
MEFVWIPAFGTPAARMAVTIAPTLVFAADSATADLAADRDTDTDNDATSGVTITDPDPSTLSDDGEAVSATAADAKISDKTATTATIRTGIETPSIDLQSTASYTPSDRFHHTARNETRPPRPRLIQRPSHQGTTTATGSSASK